MKNRSHRYDINRLSPRHGHKYTKYKMCLGIMQYVSSIHKKVKKHWNWV